MDIYIYIYICKSICREGKFPLIIVHFQVVYIPRAWYYMLI